MRGYYVGPVRLASEVEKETKSRLLTIYKEEVYKDIDLFTHKHADAHEEMGLHTGNAVSSDSSENVDMAVLSRLVELRDSKLRVIFQHSLEEIEKVSADNRITLDDDAFRYHFMVTDDFNDNTLKPLVEFIQRYLVYGALFDWYSQMGMQQAAFYGSQLQDVEEQLSSILRGRSIVKRPMQPFGPAKKF